MRAAIAEWQERAGLTSPSPEQRARIQEARKAIYRVLEILTLEESGIRDGDGTWHGSNAFHAVGDTFRQLATDLYEMPDELVRSMVRAATGE
jgi:hypothetical protein